MLTLLVSVAFAAAGSLPYKPDCSRAELCQCPWRAVFPVTELKLLGVDIHPHAVVQCPGQAWCDWRVFDDPTGVVAYHSSSAYRQDALPPGVKPPTGNYAWHSKGYRLVAPVEDGWIVAHGFGEPHSGLSWVAKDGSRDRFFGGFKVAELVQTKVGLVAATGVHDDHQNREGVGGVLLIQRTRERGWHVRPLASVGTAAWTAARGPDGSIFVVTTTQLVRVTLAGKVTVRHTGRWNELFDASTGPLLMRESAPFNPNSIVVRPAGDIFIGMRAAVVHLVPRKGGYREEWLAPRTCAK